MGKNSVYLGVFRTVSRNQTYWACKVKVGGKQVVRYAKDELTAAWNFNDLVTTHNLPHPLNPLPPDFVPSQKTRRGTQADAVVKSVVEQTQERYIGSDQYKRDLEILKEIQDRDNLARNEEKRRFKEERKKARDVSRKGKNPRNTPYQAYTEFVRSMDEYMAAGHDDLRTVDINILNQHITRCNNHIRLRPDDYRVLQGIRKGLMDLRSRCRAELGDSVKNSNRSKTDATKLALEELWEINKQLIEEHKGVEKILRERISTLESILKLHGIREADKIYS